MNQEAPNNIVYIALWGKKGSGKTAIAKQIFKEIEKLEDELPSYTLFDFHILSFSNKLKQAHAHFFPGTAWNMLDPETKEKHRLFMQGCADAVKQVSPDYFAKDLVSQAESLYSEFNKKVNCTFFDGNITYIIVDDLRFYREYEILKESGQVILINITSPLQLASDSHNSEAHTGLKKVTTFNWHNNLSNREGELILQHIEKQDIHKLT